MKPCTFSNALIASKSQLLWKDSFQNWCHRTTMVWYIEQLQLVFVGFMLWPSGITHTAKQWWYELEQQWYSDWKKV